MLKIVDKSKKKKKNYYRFYNLPIKELNEELEGESYTKSKRNKTKQDKTRQI